MTTKDFYSRNAVDFFERTVNVEMHSIYERFLDHVAIGGRILDAGCGSGRDSKAFTKLGYVTVPMDASGELAALAEKYTGLSVIIKSFQEIDFFDEFDGIWACASLLHVPEAELAKVLNKLWNALRTNGVLYCSFKYGDGESVKEGRHFTDANERRIKGWLEHLQGVEYSEFWCSKDIRPDSTVDWINAIVKKSEVIRT